MSRHEWNPGELLEMSGSYWRSCTLHAAIKLDVFTAIGNEQLTGEEVSQKLRTDKRASIMLLNALAAMDLLEKAGDRYINTFAARSFLSKDSHQYIGYMIMHHHHLVDSWSQLDQAVRTGHPVRGRAASSEEEWRESFLMGMFNMAMSLAPQVAAKIDLSSRRHLLDLGGGPGTYAINFCLRNEHLKATVYDLPTTKPFAQKTIAKFGLSDRIDFMSGDYVKGEIKGVYDVAWLSQILHGDGPADCQNIIQKTVSVLEPGGMILVHEFILNDSMDGPVFPAIFSLNMLLGTEKGQSYSEKQIGEMLANAGVKQIERLSFQSPNDSGIIAGIV